jgi:hypothetical protein
MTSHTSVISNFVRSDQAPSQSAKRPTGPQQPRRMAVRTAYSGLALGAGGPTLALKTATPADSRRPESRPKVSGPQRLLRNC